MSDSRELTIAVCLFPDLTALDYQGPVELLGFLKQENIISRRFPTVPKYTLRITYLSHTLDPVPSSPGPDAVPQETYRNTIDNNNQFDIILVPGGSSNPPSLSISRPNCNLTALGRGARPELVSNDLLEFIKHQAPGAKYILSVCTGSWILAGTGILDGKKATTNKSAFRTCKVIS